MSEPTRMVTHTLEARQLWQQVGWRGQTGAFYQLSDDPSVEHGSFAPVWEMLENEPPLISGDETP